jgi:peptidoglycan/xylan/chitin deacetylase (PgdA/CDA1 family)
MKGRMLQYKNQYPTFPYIFFLFIFIVLSACSTIPRERKLDDFIIVHTKEGDSPESLSMQYLNEPREPWRILGFNEIDSLVSGQDIIIPLKPFKTGGLTPAGYQTIPVLSYKQFSNKKQSSSSVSKVSFEKQMEYLKKNNFNVISLNQFLAFINFKAQLHDKSVLLIIDSIDKSVYDIAFPILKKYQFPSAIFITPDQIGQKNMVNWEQISQMSTNRIDIQCKIKNTIYTFPQNGTFYRYFKTLKKEVEHAVEILDTKLKKKCRFFLYPSGKYNSLLINILQKQGIQAAFIDQKGKNPFFIHHYGIHYTELSGDYDVTKFENLLEIFQNLELK